MEKIAIILYGPPGSGKGTQANLLASKTSLMHFDTGRFLEAVVHDPARRKEKLIQKERKLFDSGMLMTPSFVLREAKRETSRIARAGAGIIFTGSPRTEYEARGLFPLLRKLYSKKKIFIFELRVPDAVSITRNGSRMICKVCGYTLLAAFYPKTRRPAKHCPVCGGLFYKRTLDTQSVIKVRLKEYRERTIPVFTLAKKMGFRVVTINATLPPYRVYRNIHAFLKNALRY